MTSVYIKDIHGLTVALPIGSVARSQVDQGEETRFTQNEITK